MLFFGIMVNTVQSSCSTCCLNGNQLSCSCISSFNMYAAASCNLCLNKCATCSSQTRCLTCEPQYFLQTTGNCGLCFDFCLTCTNENSCSSCVTGFYYESSSNTCGSCIILYSLSCTSASTVLACQPTYYINGNSCLACRPNCKTCVDSISCQACLDGFQIKTGAGQFCSQCPQLCLSCRSDLNLCEKCVPGYIPQALTCVAIINCLSNCAVCLNSLTCYTCSTGYFISLNGQCLQSNLLPSVLCGNLGAIGNRYYQCMNCNSKSYNPANSRNQYLCLPMPVSMDYTVRYLYIDPEINDLNLPTAPRSIQCSGQISLSAFYTPQVSGTISLSLSLPYYFQLAFTFKLVATTEIARPFTVTATIGDGVNTQTFTTTLTSASVCTEFLISGTTRKVSRQTTSLSFSSSEPQLQFGLSESLLAISLCGPNCLSCSNNRYCIICAPPKVLLNNQCANSCGNLLVQTSIQGYISCVSTCSDGYFAVISTNSRACTACSGRCLTCLSAVSCLSCVLGQNFFYNDLTNACLDSTQQCSKGYFKDSIRQVCSKCITPCATCTANNNCLTCSVGYFYNGKCQGTCLDGYFANQQTASCDSCLDPCSTCINSNSNCLSCKGGTFLLNNQCLAACPAGYFSNINLCALCDPSCSRCSAGTANSCTQCLFYSLQIIDKATSSGKCVGTCPTFYFSSNQICTACLLPCSACQSGSDCVDCSPIASNIRNVLYQSSCIEPANCPQGFFVSSSSVAGISYYDNGNAATGNLITGTVTQNKCLACISPCKTCSSNKACSSCVVGFYYQPDASCPNICPDGYFGDSNKAQCVLCPISCSRCNSISLCTACKPQYSLQGSQCQATCNLGFYSSVNICVNCPVQCSACVSNRQCTGCSNPYFLSGTSCLSSCPVNFFGSGTQCQNCGLNCNRCVSTNQCTRCNTNFYLTNKICVQGSDCPAGTYPDSSTQSCQNCVSPCQGCSSSRTCTSCIAGLFLSSSGTCESCPSGSYIQQSGLTQVCTKCAAPCATCASIQACSSCQPNFFLYNSQCLSLADCKSKTSTGVYPNSQLWSCASCLSPCLTCQSSTACLSCSTGFLYQKTCLTVCPSTFYSQGSQCSPCNSANSGCLDCTVSAGKQQCLTCIQNKFLSDRACLSSCPEDTFIDSNYPSVCQKCLFPCATCNSVSSCKTCSFGFLLDQSCLASCPLQYFIRATACVRCDASCYQCQDSQTNCVNCNNGLFLKNNLCVLSNKCGDGFFPDQRSQLCLQCIAPCSFCSSLTYCLSCIQVTAVLSSGVCLSSCPDGKFIASMNGQQTCITCDTSCATCTGSSSKQCTACSNQNLYILNGECITCPSGMFGNSISGTCANCQSPCKTCLAASKCLTCVNASYLLVVNQCLLLSACPNAFYLQAVTANSCQKSCEAGYLADPSSGRCVKSCPNNYMVYQASCTSQCPQSTVLVKNMSCKMCESTQCNKKLVFRADPKVAFNDLYLRVYFSQSVTTTPGFQFSSQNFQINFYDYLVQSSVGRRTASKNYPFILKNFDNQTLLIQLYPNTTLTNQQIELWMVDVAGKLTKLDGSLLQNSKDTQRMQRFDWYTNQQRAASQQTEFISLVLSGVLVATLLINVLFNNVYLAYPLLDFFQLNFMLIFVALEYPPNLNYFLNGFRVSHYLFLPQIFSIASPLQKGPFKFDFIVQDVNFLRNTGNSFLLLIICLAAALILLLLQYIIDRQVRKIGQEELEAQGSRLPSLKIFFNSILARFQFNYLNDMFYIVYYYMGLFVFAQMLDFPGKSGYDQASCACSVFVLIALIVFPIFLICTVWFNYQYIYEGVPTPQLKFAIAGIDRNSHFGVILRLLQYPRKLITIMVLVLGLQNPQYIYAWLMVVSFCMALLLIVLKPYSWRVQNWFYVGLELCHLLSICLLSIMSLRYSQLNSQSKLIIGWVYVVMNVIFAVLLVSYNLLVNINQLIFYFTGVNHMENWRQQKVNDFSSEGSDSENSVKDQKAPDSNILLQDRIQNVDANQVDDNSDQDYNPFLQEGEGAPRFLMKCMKRVNGQNQIDYSEDSQEF